VDGPNPVFAEPFYFNFAIGGHHGGLGGHKLSAAQRNDGHDVVWWTGSRVRVETAFTRKLCWPIGLYWFGINRSGIC